MHSFEETLQVQLADRYLLGQLTPEQAARAERAILADPRLQRRAVVTQRLIAALRAARPAQPATTAKRPLGETRRDWYGLASSAALVAIAVAGITWWATTAFWNNAPAATLAENRTIAAANVASVELGLTRGASVVPRLELSADQTIAIVALDVGIPETPVYQVQLYSGESMIWSTESARPAEDERIHLALKTKRIGPGELLFLAQPADGLGNELRLPLKIVYRD